jgi:homoserine dehydrogenase
MHFKLAFIGFGTVGQGLTEILLEKKKMLTEKYDFEFTVVAISDMIKGSVYDEQGLDMAKILTLVKSGKKLDMYPSGIKGLNSIETIKQTNADVIVEVTYTDVKTGEPALTHIITAFESGKHVISTNKGPVVKQVKNLLERAKTHQVYYGFEGVVLAGTPVLNLVEYTLAGNHISGFKGILNGTTNYILTRMEEGMSYEEALKKAQELGYAEADPTGDVEGLDALGKVVILTNVVLDKHIGWKDVEREGITGISIKDIQKAKQEGKRWKLIGSAQILSDGTVKAKVCPEKLPLSDPLAGVNEAINALTFFTDELGPVTIVGPGAGRRETGFALLIDLLNLNRTLAHANK